MRKFLKEYNNPEEKRINFDLINRVDDGNLVDYIIDCCKSLEVLDYIKFKGYELITNEADINTSEYIDQRARGKKDSKSTKYMYMYDNRNAELRLTFDLHCGDETDTITKKILIPIPDEDGYYTVKGNKYFLLWQIVDNSTYTTKSSLILKSMMPVIIKMQKHSYISTSGEAFMAPTYTINIFRKDMDIMLFYLANGGIAWTLKYFSMDKIMSFTSEVIDNKKYIYFQIHSKLFIEVNREFFMKYTYVKSVTFMILKVMSNRVSVEDLFNKHYWIEAIGAIGTSNKNSQYDKGEKTMTFFNRIIDDTTKRILKLHPIHTKSIYSIIRWLVQNFEPLRRKDNLDLGNKRLRCNEYIASLLTKIFSERVNRIIAMGNKATMKNVKEIFKFNGDIILSQLHSSGLLRFDDRVNDMDFFLKLKLTSKGPNSLGNKNDNNISAKYRSIHPSYIGRIDLNVCGTSDPGTSSLATPFCNTHGLYFDDNHEPEDFKYNFDKDIETELLMKDDCLNITSPLNDSNEYYDYIMDINNPLYSISMSSISNRREGLYYIEINLDTDDINIIE